MNVIQRLSGAGEYKKPTKEEAVKAKMKVLREFYIVDKSNEEEIKSYLWQEILKHPNTDYESVLDHAARVLIDKKLAEV